VGAGQDRASVCAERASVSLLLRRVVVAIRSVKWIVLNKTTPPCPDAKSSVAFTPARFPLPCARGKGKAQLRAEDGGNVPKTQYSGNLTAAEEGEFTPFLHELIACAFSVIQPLFLAPIEVDRKADHTPVTEADRGAERRMRSVIELRYPAHGVIGEEFGERPAAPGAQRYRWILDPVDGTKAFISHCFLFGTLIALERDDGAGFRPILGCIAHAAAGAALIGHRGQTILFRRDGTQRPVQVRDARPIGESTVLMTSMPGSGEQGSNPVHVRGVSHIASAAGLARTWGDCFGYFALATGGADAMLDPVLSYWDVAAVVPVVEGAGGVVSSFQGGDPLVDLSLVAAGATLHEELINLIARA